MNKLKELLHEIIYTYFNAFKQITNYSEKNVTSVYGSGIIDKHKEMGL